MASEKTTPIGCTCVTMTKPFGSGALEWPVGEEVGRDDIANVEQAVSGHAIKRRYQRGVAELSLGTFDGSLIALYLSTQLIDGSALIIYLLSRNRIFFC